MNKILSALLVSLCFGFATISVDGLQEDRPDKEALSANPTKEINSETTQVTFLSRGQDVLENRAIARLYLGLAENSSSPVSVQNESHPQDAQNTTLDPNSPKAFFQRYVSLIDKIVPLFTECKRLYESCSREWEGAFSSVEKYKTEALRISAIGETLSPLLTRYETNKKTATEKVQQLTIEGENDAINDILKPIFSLDSCKARKALYSIGERALQSLETQTFLFRQAGLKQAHDITQSPHIDQNELGRFISHHTLMDLYIGEVAHIIILAFYIEKYNNLYSASYKEEDKIKFGEQMLKSIIELRKIRIGQKSIGPASSPAPISIPTEQTVNLARRLENCCHIKEGEVRSVQPMPKTLPSLAVFESALSLYLVNGNGNDRGTRNLYWGYPNFLPQLAGLASRTSESVYLFMKDNKLHYGIAKKDMR